MLDALKRFRRRHFPTRKEMIEDWIGEARDNVEAERRVVELMRERRF